MRKNVLKEKSHSFAIRIVKLSQFMQTEKKEYILSRQILKSGTAIGALIWEAEHAQSRADFINKMNIALKEANETEYWLLLLKDTDYLDDNAYKSLFEDCDELVAMLVSTVKTLKASPNKK
jgi:four helix bundle protein